jgi:hypothetical protein
MFKKLILFLLLIGTLLHATPATQENLIKLYIATFDRVPDAKGLQYWLDSGWEIEAIAISFFDQEETKVKYPEGFSLPDFINAIYANLFDRDADSEGFEYWLEALQKDETLRPLFILAVINGALGDDVKILSNKTEVGLAFVRAGRDDVVQAHDVIAEVTEETPTVGVALCKYTLAGCPIVPTEEAKKEDTSSISGDPVDQVSAEESEKEDTSSTSGAPANQAPTATDQDITFAEDSSNNYITLAGTDPENSTLTYEIVGNPSNGTLGGSVGNITYTPDANYAGTDSFTFKVKDNGNLYSTTATVSITVTQVNDAPTADAQSVETNEETSKPITLTGSDPENDALTYTITDNPTSGTLDTSSLPNVIYTPNDNYDGDDSFKFTVTEINSGGLVSAKATVSITVKNVNKKPIANAGDDQSTTEVGDTISLDGSGSSDPDSSGTITYLWSITYKPTDSTAVLSNTEVEAPSFTADKAGSYTISLVVNDETENSDADTVTITTIESVCEASTDTITDNEIAYKEVCSPHTQKIWLDRNLGASQVCTALDDTACYGDYYQWGRDADGHQVSTSAITATLATDVDNTGTANFIINDNSDPYDWASVDADGAIRSANWSKADGTSVCPTGYRVPTKAELEAEMTGAGVSSIITAFSSFLKLPSAGGRRSNNGSMNYPGFWGDLWSASVDDPASGPQSYGFYFGSDDAGWSNDGRAGGFSVRCLKVEVQ